MQGLGPKAVELKLTIRGERCAERKPMAGDEAHDSLSKSLKAMYEIELTELSSNESSSDALSPTLPPANIVTYMHISIPLLYDSSFD